MRKTIAVVILGLAAFAPEARAVISQTECRAMILPLLAAAEAIDRQQQTLSRFPIASLYSQAQGSDGQVEAIQRLGSSRDPFVEASRALVRDLQDLAIEMQICIRE